MAIKMAKTLRWRSSTSGDSVPIRPVGAADACFFSRRKTRIQVNRLSGREPRSFYLGKEARMKHANKSILVFSSAHDSVGTSRFSIPNGRPS